MDAKREDILAKVRACLNLASRNANTSEAEMATALGMAKRMMAKYNLEEAEVMASDPDSDLSAVEEVTAETYASPHPFENHLAMVCKSLFTVEPLLSWEKVNGKPRKVIKFYGLLVDIQLAAEAFKILRNEINQLASASGFQGKEVHHYRVGVVYTLRLRAKEMGSGLTEAEDVKCRDLVVTKDAMIKEHIAENVGKTKPTNTGRHYDEAYRRGKVDGSSVNLNFSGSVSGKTSGQKALR